MKKITHTHTCTFFGDDETVKADNLMLDHWPISALLWMVGGATPHTGSTSATGVRNYNLMSRTQRGGSVWPDEWSAATVVGWRKIKDLKGKKKNKIIQKIIITMKFLKTPLKARKCVLFDTCGCVSTC